MACDDSIRSMRRLSCVVPVDLDGARIDVVLRKQLGISGSAIRRAKYADDGITVNGARQRVSFLVTAGDKVSILIDDTGLAKDSTVIVSEPGPIDVVFEDDDIVIVNKPAGMVVYPVARHNSGTLANRLMHYLREKGIECNLHPVNRLDMSTSGLIVFAKNSHAHYALQNQLHSGDFERTYLAICTGVPHPERARIDVPIGLVQDRKKVLRELVESGQVGADGTPAPGCSVDTRKIRNVYGVCSDGRPAATNYEVLSVIGHPELEGDCSLVRLVLETGRTHQIRIHMAHIGHALLGDDAYGETSEAIDRAALHSHEVSILHPVTGELICVMAPLPDDMLKVMGD